ncbi:MAG: hypothetical protein ACD_40C00108G0003 [uncultured bacterium]|nr:MAG: hypothetical protein ACD_40C00108G0003 [uncultured bacterium]
MIAPSPANLSSPKPQSFFPPQPSKHTEIIILLLIFLGFISSFVSGYFIKDWFIAESNSTTQPQPSSVPTTNTDKDSYLPGKAHQVDTVYILVKASPQPILIATVSRQEQNQNFAQTTRISYFDGSTWTRDTKSQTTASIDIATNDLIQNWQIDTDPTRVMKQSATGNIKIHDLDLAFDTQELRNEIPVRSLPGYTRFYSVGSGTLTIAGQNFPAYVLYSRLYSSDSSQIQFYNQPFGLTTNWLAFWDQDGNFYHVDTTQVDQSTDIYQTHQIGIFESNQRSVTTIFSVPITADTQTPPLNYTFKFTSPVNRTITLTTKDSQDKYPQNPFSWFMSRAQGQVTTAGGQNIPGVGLLEYIHN